MMNPIVPVALINNAVTPYRLHLHTRLVDEMPRFQFWSLFTHDISNAPWSLPVSPGIRPVFFGPQESSLASSALISQGHEWRKAGTILRWIREHAIQAVVLGGYDDIGRLRILWWCRRQGVPCFLFGDSNIRGDLLSGWKARLKRFLLTRVLRLCTGVLCCGSFGEQYFQRYGVASDRIYRFPYEPDYERIRSAGITYAYGLQPGRRYLLYSGRLISVKRVDLLIRAFIQIASHRSDWDLVISGAGDQLDLLQAMVPESLATRIHWTGFVNDPDTVARLYASTHVLVLPSDYEPWGVVITEAAVRMPIVASSMVGAAADVVQDGVNGRVFPAGDLDALVECLLDVTTSSTLAAMAASAPVQFAAWHAASDPAAGLRAALNSAHLYSQ